jgi:hypothetical protein
MYRARLPRTKTLSPVPAASFDGTLAIDGRELRVDGWRGMVGHNWGAQHAERWIWLHGLTESGDWLDAVVGRVRIGPVTTPWVASGALSLAGERHRLGGTGRRLRLRESQSGCELVLRGGGVHARVEVGGPAKDFVAWVYDDPAGGEHDVVNCSICDLHVAVEGGPELVAHRGAAYELGGPRR